MVTKFGIGQSARRVEDRRFLVGAGRYMDDINLPRQCYGAAVLSLHAHAVIRSIDTSRTACASRRPIWMARARRFWGARSAAIGPPSAHTCPERLSAAVSWGGGAHFMFQRDWVEASRHPERYLMELVETRSRMLGARNDAEYVDAFADLSVLDQGLLDRPRAPLLLVNGKEDRQCPIADIHLLLEHGDPKAVRLFPGGHMEFGPQTVPAIVRWLETQMANSRGAA